MNRLQNENHQIEFYMNQLQGDALKHCVDAMKLLIDTRWAHFEHVLNASLSSSNFFVDAAVTGLATSIPLVPPGTKNVLGAIAAGLSGTRRNFNEDILYSYSIQTILQQMKMDRAQQAIVIEGRLSNNPRGYRDMYEAAIDLFEYDQAGSWDHAMASLQANVDARMLACQARERDQKLNLKPTITTSAGITFSTQGGSTTTDPCNLPNVKPGLSGAELIDAKKGISVSFVTDKTLATGYEDKIKSAITVIASGNYAEVVVNGATAPGTNTKLASARCDTIFGLIKLGLDAEVAKTVKFTCKLPTSTKDKNAKITFVPKQA